MKYAYYPGCSLTGSARRLDKGVRKIFAKLGHELAEIPDWNCCGAFEYRRPEGAHRILKGKPGEEQSPECGRGRALLLPVPHATRI